MSAVAFLNSSSLYSVYNTCLHPKPSDGGRTVKHTLWRIFGQDRSPERTGRRQEQRRARREDRLVRAPVARDHERADDEHVQRHPQHRVHLRADAVLDQPALEVPHARPVHADGGLEQAEEPEGRLLGPGRRREHEEARRRRAQDAQQQRRVAQPAGAGEPAEHERRRHHGRHEAREDQPVGQRRRGGLGRAGLRGPERRRPEEDEEVHGPFEHGRRQPQRHDLAVRQDPPELALGGLAGGRALLVALRRPCLAVVLGLRQKRS